MTRKETNSEAEFAAVLTGALDVAELPMGDMDFDFDGPEYDLDALGATPATLHRPASTKAPPLPVSGTRPISIRVPAWAINAFRAHAEETGKGYQTLMIRTLKSAAREILYK